MNAIELMETCKPSFSKTDHAIYETIRKFPDNFATQSVTQLSNNAGYSKPALTRFAQRLGFSGFMEFQYQFSQDLAAQRSRTDAQTNAEVYGNLLRAVEERVDRERLQQLAELICASDAVYPMGYNLSRLAAEALNISLQFVESARSVFAPIDVPPTFRPNDLLIVYSAISGASFASLMDSFKAGRNVRPHMVLVTTNPKHPLRRRFDEVFVLPTATLAVAGNTVLSDTFAFLMFNDLLAANLPGDKSDATTR